MSGELHVGGVFFSPLLLWAVVAVGLSFVFRRLLASVGFYRLVWHRALFDLALYVILLAAVTAVGSRL